MPIVGGMCDDIVNLNFLPDQELITVLGKQMDTTILEYDFSLVENSAGGVPPAEVEAMELVFKHAPIPVPELLYSNFSTGHGVIHMPIVPGPVLEGKWDTLDEQAKESICLPAWEILSKIRSPSRDPSFEDLDEPRRPLLNDSDVRTRIFERYYHIGGPRLEHELPDILPQSESCVFTLADTAPRNVKVDEQNSITGILD
ncbi:hypothetical protein BBP40_003275 [Aspergillus hancockii]|nr:hypothetical protein BBP40_003275 [Aspergillus hancockii]